MEISDNQLVRLIKEGDRRLFAVLVERYNSPIFNLMYRHCGTIEDSADLTQDVFCRAFEKLKTYREHKSFFAWLYRIALNRVRDWERRQYADRKKQASISSLTQETIPSPEKEIQARQQQLELLEALAKLPADRQEMLTLRYRHDCSIKDLAEIFAIKESAVKMRLKRSIEALGKELQSEGYEEQTNIN